MATKKTLAEIKKYLEASVGKKIKLKANRGRKKIIEKFGILEQTYPNIFIVKVKDKENIRRISFSYTDILTDTVELTIFKEQEEIEKIG